MTTRAIACCFAAVLLVSSCGQSKTGADNAFGDADLAWGFAGDVPEPGLGYLVMYGPPGKPGAASGYFISDGTEGLDRRVDGLDEPGSLTFMAQQIRNPEANDGTCRIAVCLALDRIGDMCWYDYSPGPAAVAELRVLFEDGQCVFVESE